MMMTMIEEGPENKLTKIHQETGLPLLISEYDIGEADDEKQKTDYANHIPCMKTIIKEETSPWKILWLTIVSLFYYMSVRLFGYFYFNYDKNDLQS